MPTIHASCPPAIALGEPFPVDVAIQAGTPGPASLHFEIGNDSPYLLKMRGAQGAHLICQRSLDESDCVTQVEIQVVRRPVFDSPVSLRLTVAGLEGSSSAVSIPLTISQP